MSLKSFSQIYCQSRKAMLREVITLTNTVRLYLSPDFIWRKTDAVTQSQFRKANLFKKPQKQQISMDCHACFVTLIKAAEEFRHATHPCLSSDSNTSVSTPAARTASLNFATRCFLWTSGHWSQYHLTAMTPKGNIYQCMAHIPKWSIFSDYF